MLGLGWLVFAMAKSQAAALVIAGRAATVEGRGWPGNGPRQVRIVELQNNHGRTDPAGQNKKIHKLNGAKFGWPEQWTAKRDPKEAAMLELMNELELED